MLLLPSLYPVSGWRVSVSGAGGCAAAMPTLRHSASRGIGTDSNEVIQQQQPKLLTRALDEASRRFHNHGEGPYYGLLLVETVMPIRS